MCHVVTALTETGHLHGVIESIEDAKGIDRNEKNGALKRLFYFVFGLSAKRRIPEGDVSKLQMWLKRRYVAIGSRGPYVTVGSSGLPNWGNGAGAWSIQYVDGDLVVRRVNGKEKCVGRETTILVEKHGRSVIDGIVDNWSDTDAFFEVGGGLFLKFNDFFGEDAELLPDADTTTPGPRRSATAPPQRLHDGSFGGADDAGSETVSVTSMATAAATLAWLGS